MKHMTGEEALHRRVLQRARTVAIIGASPNPARHSYTVADYLKTDGYDVIPIRPDGVEVAGLPACVRLAEVAGPVDLVGIFRRPVAVPAHIEEAAAKQVEAVWLPPGAWSPEAKTSAERHGLTFIKDLCIAEEHRHLSQRSGHPIKWGVHVRRRKPTYRAVSTTLRQPDSAFTVATPRCERARSIASR